MVAGGGHGRGKGRRLLAGRAGSAGRAARGGRRRDDRASGLLHGRCRAASGRCCGRRPARSAARRGGRRARRGSRVGSANSAGRVGGRGALSSIRGTSRTGGKRNEFGSRFVAGRRAAGSRRRRRRRHGRQLRFGRPWAEARKRRPRLLSDFGAPFGLDDDFAEQRGRILARRRGRARLGRRLGHDRRRAITGVQHISCGAADRRRHESPEDQSARASARVAAPLERNVADCRVGPLHASPTLNASLRMGLELKQFRLAPINADRSETPDGNLSRWPENRAAGTGF